MRSDPLFFTNIQQEADDTRPWEMVDETPIAPGQMQTEGKPFYSKTEMIGHNTDPLEDAKWEDPESFRQEVFRRIGGNPDEIDEQAELDRYANSDDIKNFFYETFNGQIGWNDWGRMTPQEKDHWNLAWRKKRADIWRETSTKKNKMKQQVDYYMGNFKAKAKEYIAIKNAKAKAKQANAKGQRAKAAKDAEAKLKMSLKARGTLEKEFSGDSYDRQTGTFYNGKNARIIDPTDVRRIKRTMAEAGDPNFGDLIKVTKVTKGETNWFSPDEPDTEQTGYFAIPDTSYNNISILSDYVKDVLTWGDKETAENVVREVAGRMKGWTPKQRAHWATIMTGKHVEVKPRGSNTPLAKQPTTPPDVAVNTQVVKASDGKFYSMSPEEAKAKVDSGEATMVINTDEKPIPATATTTEEGQKEPGKHMGYFTDKQIEPVQTPNEIAKLWADQAGPDVDMLKSKAKSYPDKGIYGDEKFTELEDIATNIQYEASSQGKDFTVEEIMVGLADELDLIGKDGNKISEILAPKAKSSREFADSMSENKTKIANKPVEQAKSAEAKVMREGEPRPDLPPEVKKVASNWKSLIGAVNAKTKEGNSLSKAAWNNIRAILRRAEKDIKAGRDFSEGQKRNIGRALTKLGPVTKADVDAALSMYKDQLSGEM